jgi:hypothetical protein
MKVQKLPSDVVGLSKVMPPLSRRGFMTSSAAEPSTRRRHPHRHQWTGKRQRPGHGSRRQYAGLLRSPGQRAEPTDRPRRHGNFRTTRIHQGRHAQAGPSRRVRRRAGVAFYGFACGCPLRRDAAERARICQPSEGTSAWGADDAGIKVEQVKAMEEKLKSAGKTAEFHIYPGAPHGFHADYRPSYRKEAAADGWNRMIEWFKKYKVLA